MRCVENQGVPEPTGSALQHRVQEILTPYAAKIDYFKLLAPQNQDNVSLIVVWRNQPRPDCIVAIRDETNPDASEILGLLDP
jgi:hypothetical protein